MERTYKFLYLWDNIEALEIGNPWERDDNEIGYF